MYRKFITHTHGPFWYIHSTSGFLQLKILRLLLFGHKMQPFSTMTWQERDAGWKQDWLERRWFLDALAECTLAPMDRDGWCSRSGRSFDLVCNSPCQRDMSKHLDDHGCWEEDWRGQLDNYIKGTVSGLQQCHFVPENCFEFGDVWPAKPWAPQSKPDILCYRTLSAWRKPCVWGHAWGAIPLVPWPLLFIFLRAVQRWRCLAAVF